MASPSPASWHQVYTILETPQIPWNAGGPDSDLVRLVESGRIKPGRAVDLGSGLGWDAIFLAGRGFSVLAADIAASAVSMAKGNAGLAQVAEKIEFQTVDALTLALPLASVDFVNDRGLFHFLDAAAQKRYLELVSHALKRDGLFLLRTFSEKEPIGPGPRRYSLKELEAVFSPRFDFLETKEGVFEGPQKPKAILCLLRKRS